MPRQTRVERRSTAAPRHTSFRFSASTAERLEARARELGISRTKLAERYIDEGLRTDRHPAIVFRDGAAGRRAALAGTRLDVWQVIDTVRNEGGSVAAAARLLGQPEARVAAAVRYYAEFKGEVDAFAAAARAAAAEAEAAWQREREALA